MTDYREPGARQLYFDALYRMNLEHGVMPGCVYLYLPELARAKGWGPEDQLWFAFLNGMTQNPLTSLRLMDQLGQPPATRDQLAHFEGWFNTEWPRLQFDTDRRYAKKETPAAIKSYCRALNQPENRPNGEDSPVCQTTMFGGTWEGLWELVTGQFRSFGRLSAFSYLEYVRIFGYGADCADLLFEDRDGSKSHRNGMLFLCNMDHLVWDKRTGNGFGGEYQGYAKMCAWLDAQAREKLVQFADLPNASLFTFESQLCTFKNSFFGRRYPGVYADMGYERLQWYEKNVGKDHNWKLIMEIREALPDWLRLEAKHDGLTIPQRGAVFPTTGVPYRAEHFLA